MSLAYRTDTYMFSMQMGMEKPIESNIKCHNLLKGMEGSQRL